MLLTVKVVFFWSRKKFSTYISTLLLNGDQAAVMTVVIRCLCFFSMLHFSMWLTTRPGLQKSVQWGSVSAQQSLQFHTHQCTRPLEFLIHGCLTFPSESNGCWHILEPCCPTRPLSCAGQVRGSAQCNLAMDEKKHTNVISPATNRFQSCTSVLFTGQMKVVIYIQRGKTHPIRGF